MIPADLAARLRLLTEASFFETEPPVPGLQRAREIQSQLPDLLPGQRITAALQRALPDGSFQAVVAGRDITLALPHSAKAGDTLELVVTQTTPRVVFAQLADAPPPNVSARPELSPTGRLISFLLTGQPAAEPAQLAGGRPLLNAPPHSGAPLVPVLRQALSQSGLFYESQQGRWLGGQVSTQALQSQPQGQPGATPGSSLLGNALLQGGAPPGTAAGLQAGTAGQAGTPGASAGAAAGSTSAGNPGSPPTGAAASVAGGRAAVAGADAGSGAERATAAESAGPARMTAVPERLLPVVHQQLDALATQQYVWHGQAWPGQPFELQIDDPGSEGEGDGSGDAREWHTSLRLSLPRLGGVEAHLYLGAQGLALRLQAEDDTTVQTLMAGKPALESALEAVGIKLTGMAVEVPDGGR